MCHFIKIYPREIRARILCTLFPWCIADDKRSDKADEEAMKIFRNLAISRLVKKGDPGFNLRSGSLSPKLAALWKTRVQRSESQAPGFSALWKTRVG